MHIGQRIISFEDELPSATFPTPGEALTEPDQRFDTENWISKLEVNVNHTPLSGYLSTPSKRATRARELVGMSTTPIGTPFRQRLRSAMSAPRSNRQKELGRSTNLRGSTFGTILEASPRTPGAQ